MFFRPFLEHKAERCAAVVAAVANAAPGGVLVHCAGGRDRTGLASLLLLALVGVDHEDIAADYGMSTERLLPLYERMGIDSARVQAALAKEPTIYRATVLETLASLDAEATMRAAGLRDAELAALRARLLDPPPA